MPSKKSSHNSIFYPSIFMMNLKQGWPVWIVLCLLNLFHLPIFILLVAQNEYESEKAYSIVNLLLQLATGFNVMTIIWAIVIAMLLFRYLMTLEQSSNIHALPVTKNGLFFTNYITGLFILIVSSAIAYGLSAVLLCAIDLKSCMSALGFCFFGTLSRIVFFYSFAVFCTMFTGQLFAAPIFYAIWNGFGAAIAFSQYLLSDMFLYGYTMSSDSLSIKLLSYLCPAWGYSRGTWYNIENTDSGYVYTCGGAKVLIIYALVGILFAVAALFIYRIRKNESAGTAVSIPFAKPIFKYGCGLLGGLLVGMFVYSSISLFYGSSFFNQHYPSLLICMMVSCLVLTLCAQMILDKHARFSKVGWISSILCCVILFGISMLFYADPFGYETATPNVSKLQSATVSFSGNSSYNITTEDEDLLAEITAFQKDIASAKESQRAMYKKYISQSDDGSISIDSTTIHFTYTYQSGLQTERSYTIYFDSSDIFAEGDSGKLAYDFLSQEDVALAMYNTYMQGDTASTSGKIENITLTSEDYTLEQTFDADEIDSITAAIKQDFLDNLPEIVLQTSDTIYFTHTLSISSVLPYSTGLESYFSERYGYTMAYSQENGKLEITQYISLNTRWSNLLQALEDLDAFSSSPLQYYDDNGDLQTYNEE